MTVATFLQPNSTTQNSTALGATYDGDMSVLIREGVRFAPSAQASPNMTVLLAAGHVFNGVTLTEVATQNTGTITAPGSNSRIDRVVVDQVTGSVSVVTGTPGTSPVAPAIPSGKCPVAQVLLTSSTTSITNSIITDERDFAGLGGLGGQTPYGVTTNSTNAYTVTTSPSFSSLTTGQRIYAKINAANTGSATINANGTGATTVKDNKGNNIPANTFLANSIYEFIYDGTNYILMNNTLQYLYLPYAADTGSANAYAVAPAPAIAAYVAGQVVMLKPANANTAASTIAISGLSTKSIKLAAGGDPPANAMISTGFYILVFDGTNFVLTNPSTAQTNNGGATTSSNAASITLSAGSNRLQAVAMTNPGQAVNLPDATTLSAGGGPIYIIRNVGSFSFTVLDNAGQPRAVVQPNEAVMLFCSDVSTAKGVWSSGSANSGTPADFFSTNPQTFAGPSVGVTGAEVWTCAALSATAVIVFWYDLTTTAAFKACIISIAGETLTVGATTTVEAIATGTGLAVCALSATQALVCYRTNTASKTMVLSISGTTISTNTAATLHSGGITNLQAFAISSTAAFVSFTTGAATGLVVSVSGTTPTVNSSAGANSCTSTEGNLFVSMLSATAFLFSMAGSSGFLAHQIFTVSGTTTTANTALANQSASAVVTNVVNTPISATAAMIVYNSNSGAQINAQTLTISGTTPLVVETQNNFGVANPDTAPIPTAIFVPPSKDRALVFAQSSNTNLPSSIAGICFHSFKIDPVNFTFQYVGKKIINQSNGAEKGGVAACNIADGLYFIMPGNQAANSAPYGQVLNLVY